MATRVEKDPIIKKRGKIMGLFDGGFFGGMFDLNGDGKLDFSEQALEFAFISEMMKEEKDDDDDDIFCLISRILWRIK